MNNLTLNPKNKLPKNWPIKKLGEVCKTTSGGTPSRRNYSYYEGNIPWVKSGELDKGVIYDTEEKISEEAIKNSSAKVFPKGTLLIALYGATIGKLAFLGVEAATNQAICGIYENEDIVSKYLYYFLLFNKPKLVQQGVGGAQPNISQTILKDLDFPLPPLPTQHLIVAKIEELFSELDQGIADLKTAQQQLKTYRQSVLKYAFEGKLTNENLKEGELPEGWEIRTFGDVIEISKDKYKPNKIESKFYVGLEHLEKNLGSLTPDCGIEEIKTLKNQFNKGEILYGKLRPYLNKVYLAKENGVCSTDILVLKTKENCNAQFLTHLMLGVDFVNTMSENTSGVNLPRVSTKFILEYPINLPPIEEQHRIVQEIESRLSVADKMEENITQSLQQAEALRQSILKKAFSGELVQETAKQKVFKPKSEYFFQMQLIGKIAAISKNNQIEHGEMTIAKYAYLADKIYNIPSGFKFERWHLGPYPPAIKKVVNNKQYFQKANNFIEVVNQKALFKSENTYTSVIESAVNDLVNIFSKYKTQTERAHKTELLATVCKVIEDIKTNDLHKVRISMNEWPIELKNSPFKNKAEKFNEDETRTCIDFIISKGWDEKLISF